MYGNITKEIFQIKIRINFAQCTSYTSLYQNNYKDCLL